MSDTRIQALRRQAAADPAQLDTWLALEAALMRAGLSGAETFEPVLACLVSRKNAAKAALDECRARRNAKGGQLYQAALEAAGAPLVCVRCEDRGYYTVHVPSDHAMIDTGRRPCPACVESTQPGGGWGEWHSTVKRADYPTKRKDDLRLSENAAREVALLFRDEVSTLRAESDAALDALEPYLKACVVSKGARVRYTNKRARARYAQMRDHRFGSANKHVGQRVQVGTEGVVFWAGVQEGTTRLGIKTDEGAVFFTATGNCSDRALNAWERMRGIDVLSQAQREREAAATAARSADEERIHEVFGPNGPQRGQRVRLGDHEGKVAWTGADKKTGRVRIGIKRLLGDRNMLAWGFAADAEQVGKAVAR